MGGYGGAKNCSNRLIDACTMKKGAAIIISRVLTDPLGHTVMANTLKFQCMTLARYIAFVLSGVRNLAGTLPLTVVLTEIRSPCSTTAANKSTASFVV